MQKVINKHSNIIMLEEITDRLDELCREVVFVGGCAAALLITDQAAPKPRITFDVDCIVDVITLNAYHKFEHKLREKGFVQALNDTGPLIRWECGEHKLDVVPIDSKILGFSNRWYKDAMGNPVSSKLSNGKIIKVITAPYFLATKLEAFSERGNEDYLGSHDLEDIISIIDGRVETAEEIKLTSPLLQKYLSEKFQALLEEPRFMSALPGHLNYATETAVRQQIVERRIQDIIAIDHL